MTEKIAQQLRDDILCGKWKPGQKLRIEELTATYAVGGSPVREGLSRLTALGLVTASGQKGFSVATISVDDLLDLTKTRIWIESLALRSAIEAGDRTWEAAIVSAAHMLGSEQPKIYRNHLLGYDRQWEKHHRAFHAALVAACTSPRLLSFREVLYDLSDRYRQLSVRKGNPTRNVKAEHASLMEAVLDRDAASAIKQAVDHFLRTAYLVIENTAGSEANAASVVQKLRIEVSGAL